MAWCSVDIFHLHELFGVATEAGSLMVSSLGGSRMMTPLVPETLAAFEGDELRARIFWEKYALRGPDDAPAELTPDHMWERLAAALAAVEPDPDRRTHWHREFHWILRDFRLLPGGRIMHAIGQTAVGRNAVPINCFVLPLLDDSLAAIYDLCKEMAITFSRGGGVGVDLSRLRPKGAVAHNAARISTGPVSFMETFSLVAGTIGQAGRRGALMITIRDDHPDVLEFCRIKRNRASVRYANISVLVSDAFMQAVAADAPWRLHFENAAAGVAVARTIRARELWDELIRGARDWAEPGCLFVDAARRRGTTEYNGMQVLTTNPCGEQWLDPYNNCCLASLNLLTFVRQPFADIRPVDNLAWTDLRRAVRATVRFLDNVVTYADALFPIEAQREAARRTRRIGLGITALADMLAALGLGYATDEAIDFAERLMEFIKHEAYWMSTDIAEEKGAFPAFAAEPHLSQAFFQDFPDDLRQRISTVGLRNAATMTVPPVGSGSALAGVTSGIEPIFALSYVRRSESLGQEFFNVIHPLVNLYCRASEREGPDLRTSADPQAALRAFLPPIFATAHQIDPIQRVRMQAAIARHVDNSVSSTINLPKETPVETVDQIYRLAWELGCKGITVYREGAREGILIADGAAVATAGLPDRIRGLIAEALPHITLPPPAGSPEDQALALTTDLLEHIRNGSAQALVDRVPDRMTPRPERLVGPTYRVSTAFGTAYVTITELNSEPFEMFGRLGKAGTDSEAAAEAIGRMASILLRLRSPVPRPDRLSMIAEQLERIGGSRSIGFGQDRVRSIPDAFAVAIRKYMADRDGAAVSEHPLADTPADAGSHAVTGDLCPRCQQATLLATVGCLVCVGCGFREC